MACQSAVAQSDRIIDSLQDLLKNFRADTNKVKLLNELSARWLTINSNSEARSYAEQAMALGEKLNFKSGIADAHYNLGLYYNTGNDSSAALKNFQTASKIYEEIGEKDGVANVLLVTGLRDFDRGLYAEAIQKYRLALKFYEETKNKAGMADCYNKIGRYYDHQGNYSESLRNFLASVQLFSESGNKAGMADSYSHIAGSYSHEGKYEEALENFKAALELRKIVANKGAVAGSYNDVAHILMKLGKYDDALKNNLAALKINEEIGNRPGTVGCYENIGEIYFHEGKYAPALENFLYALKLSEEIGNAFWIGVCNIDVGKTYTELHRYHEAEQYLMNGLVLSQKVGLKENVKYSYRCLIRLDSVSGNFRKALVHYNLYNQYKDSLLNETNSRQMAIMREEFQSEKRNREIALLTKESAIKDLQLKKQRQAKYYFIGSLVLIGVLSFFVYRTYHTRQKIKLLTLRNKIASDLHDDVGSTLSSISIFSQMAQQQSKETIPMLETIEDSSKKMLDAMADIVWTINPANDQFEKIIMRMKSFAFELLGAKNIDFEFVADEEVTRINVPMDVRKNLYLIFKEATNNMVKYADAKKAMFTIKGEKNNLTMLITDNGRGFDLNHPTEGNGLKNMRRRAVEIGAEFKIVSHPGDGTTIQLKVAV